MRTTLLLLAGVSLGLASLLLTRRRPTLASAAQPAADELAHKLQEAWADHHTVA